MTIFFDYTQILPTSHPLFEVTVVFKCRAEIKGDEVKITNIKAEAYTLAGSTAWQELPLPDESTSAGARFAGLLREKARDAAYKQLKAAKP